MTGPEIIHAAMPTLIARGWLVFYFNSHHPMPKGAVGCPDIVAFREDETLTIEVKGEGDRLKPKQAEVARAMLEMAGPHLRYCLAQSVEDIERVSR